MDIGWTGDLASGRVVYGAVRHTRLPVATRMSAVLAALLDRVGFRRFFGGRSMQAVVQESLRDRADLSCLEGVDKHSSAGGAKDQYRLAINHYVWEMLTAIWLLVGIAPLVVFFAVGNVPLLSGKALLIYPIVTLFSSVSWANSLATYLVRRHTSFSDKLVAMNMAWVATIVLQWGLLLLPLFAI
jgi:hypothetical protein